MKGDWGGLDKLVILEELQGSLLCRIETPEAQFLTKAHLNCGLWVGSELGAAVHVLVCRRDWGHVCQSDLRGLESSWILA